LPDNEKSIEWRRKTPEASLSIAQRKEFSKVGKRYIDIEILRVRYKECYLIGDKRFRIFNSPLVIGWNWWCETSFILSYSKFESGNKKDESNYFIQSSCFGTWSTQTIFRS